MAPVFQRSVKTAFSDDVLDATDVSRLLPRVSAQRQKRVQR